MSIHKTEAIVLRKRDFRETSLIAEFYSKDYGKFSGVLKGIRAKPGKFGSTVEPFSHTEVVFYRSRSHDLHLVGQCDTRDNFDAVRSDMIKSIIGGYMMDMLNALMMTEDKNEQIFSFSLECLRELSRAPNPHKIETIYKIKMLSLSGFKPHFDSCVSCSSRISRSARFSVSRGGLLCGRCCLKDASARLLFQGTIASILYLQRSDMRSCLHLGINPQIKRELDMALNSFLEYHLGKRLKSQRVLESVAGVGAGCE
jgi:DNA repair protein RecO (recombination protein O)